MSPRATLVALGALCLSACNASPGTLDVQLWGEEFIRDQIPPASGTEAGFDDGWTARFSKFLLTLGEVRVAATTGETAGALADYRVWDLHRFVVPTSVGTLAGVAPVRFDAVTYRAAPAGAATTAGNASADDLALMQRNGYSLYVEGELTRPGRPAYRIRWGFANATRWSSCRDANGQLGVAVPNGGSARAQITIHADHLFYDGLQNADAATRFDAMAAADRDGDHEVTLDELARVDLTTLPRGQYATGSVPGVNDLRQFVTHLTATLGHFQGEGECLPREQ